MSTILSHQSETEPLSANAGTKVDHAGRAFKEHYRTVYGVCFRELRSRELAQDAAQSVFILLANSQPKLNDNKHLLAWLLKAALYTCKNIRRSEARRQRLETAAMKNMTFSEQQNHTLFENNINQAISKLRPVDQSLIMLRYYEDRTLKEIGTTLGMSEDAVRIRIQRNLKKMCRWLKGAGVVVSVLTIEGMFAESASATTITIPSALIGTTGVASAASTTKWIPAAVGISLTLGSIPLVPILVGSTTVIAGTTYFLQTKAPKTETFNAVQAEVLINKLAGTYKGTFIWEDRWTGNSTLKFKKIKSDEMDYSTSTRWQQNGAASSIARLKFDANQSKIIADEDYTMTGSGIAEFAKGSNKFLLTQKLDNGEIKRYRFELNGEDLKVTEDRISINGKVNPQVEYRVRKVTGGDSN